MHPLKNTSALCRWRPSPQSRHSFPTSTTSCLSAMKVRAAVKNPILILVSRHFCITHEMRACTPHLEPDILFACVPHIIPQSPRVMYPRAAAQTAWDPWKIKSVEFFFPLRKQNFILRPNIFVELNHDPIFCFQVLISRLKRVSLLQTPFSYDKQP
jgi:hypothetical protein